MTFNDFKAYRKIWTEVIKLKKWRANLRKHSLAEIIGWSGIYIGLGAFAVMLMAVSVRLVCYFISLLK